MVAFRVPTRGGSVRAYLLPDLSESPWQIGGSVSSARSALGVDGPGRRLIYRDRRGSVTSFDLVAYRERTVAPPAARAALASDGTLLAVDSDGEVIESQPWGTRPWSGSVGRGVREIFAGPGSRLLLLRQGGGDSLQAVSREAGLALSAPAPSASARAATREAGAVAFATDSGVVVIEDQEPEAPWFAPLAGRPAAVAFSPSGHVLYVTLAEKSELAVVDRFTHQSRPPIPLPAPGGALRPDPWGRAVLVESGSREARETWVVSTARRQLAGRLGTRWASDLPAVSADGVLLAREGDAVVARDVRTLDSLGAVPRAGSDLWFVSQWAPSRAAAALRQEARAEAGGPRPAERASEGRLFVQLSVSQNEAWAQALANELNRQGHRAAVVPPAGAGDGWRVVLGPFETRDAADSAGRAVDRPYWIVERAQPRGP
jgi:hypothetical protein